VPGGAVALDYRGSHRLRPPRAELRFDVTVSNGADAARWAIMPDTLAGKPTALATQVWSVGAYVLGEPGRVTAVHAVAEAGWYAVLVPSGGEVRLENLPFAFWGEPGPSAELEVVLAEEIEIDGQPLLARLDLDARSDGGAAVDASPLGNEGAVTAALTGGPAAPLAVAWTGPEPLRASATLAP
jgi:hypothetical protein